MDNLKSIDFILLQISFSFSFKQINHFLFDFTTSKCFIQNCKIYHNLPANNNYLPNPVTGSFKAVDKAYKSKI